MDSEVSVVDELVELARVTPKDNVVYEFNVLNGTFANENTHTRILADLLRVPSVCESFIDYLRKHLGVESLEGFDRDDYSVETFTAYIDAQISFADKTIIIENKVKGAADQDAQIDRYVDEVVKQGTKGENIIVVYLTKDKEKTVSPWSFAASKQALGYVDEDHPGRFVRLNYADHICEWLEKDLSWSVEDIREQPYLLSGVQQYLAYINGPELLDRHMGSALLTDENRTLREKVDALLRGIGMPAAVDVRTALACRRLRSPADRTIQRVEGVTRDVVREMARETEGDQARWGLWNEVEDVNHGYWYRDGYAIQLSEYFAGEDAVRAIEFFPQRGQDVTSSLISLLEKEFDRFPYFTFGWNGRIVYKFPVTSKDSASELIAFLRNAVASSSKV